MLLLIYSNPLELLPSKQGIEHLFFSHKYSVEAKFLVPDWGVIVDYDNPMPESTISPSYIENVTRLFGISFVLKNRLI
jgi:hypothetical protein